MQLTDAISLMLGEDREESKWERETHKRQLTEPRVSLTDRAPDYAALEQLTAGDAELAFTQ